MFLFIIFITLSSNNTGTAMSQLLSSADDAMAENAMRLKRFCYRYDKRLRLCASLLSLYLFLRYFSSTNTPDVDLYEYSSASSIARVTTFDHTSLQWLNDPKLQALEVPDPSGETPGSAGDYSVTPGELTLSPPAFRDFWSRTFYSPTLVKHDASALLRPVASETECPVEVDFEVSPKPQFDQVPSPTSLIPSLPCLRMSVCIMKGRNKE